MKIRCQKPKLRLKKPLKFKVVCLLLKQSSPRQYYGWRLRWEQNPTVVEVDRILSLRSLVHIQKGEYEVAYKLFKDATQMREDKGNWKRIGVLLYAMMIPPGEYGPSLEECNTAITWANAETDFSENSVTRALLYGHKAYYHLKLGQYDEAVASCDISLQAFPRHLAPLRIMAEISLSRNEPHNAIRYLSSAIVSRTEGPHILGLC